MASFPVTNIKLESLVSNIKLESPNLFIQQQQSQENSPSLSPIKNSPSDNLQPIPKKSAIIKTDRPRPYICTTCTRAFARLEHLKRHERSHTNEKPFQCGVCGRCFARRDLVLRHQQKLHAKLPTSNRARIRKHNFDHDVQAGDIVQDYLNENINIVFKNTNAQLPLPNDLKEQDEIKQKPKKQRRTSIKKTPSSHSPNSYTSTLSSLDVSPQVVESLFGTIPQHNFKPQQQDSPITSNTSPPDKVHVITEDHQLQQYQNSTPLSYTSHGMYPSVSEHTTQEAEDISKTRGRHSSFSALCLSSYTLPKDAQDIKAHDLPEAPHQVGFATPQLTAQELSDRAVMAGFDLDALGIDARDYTNENNNTEKKLEYFGQQHHENSNNNNKGNNTPFEFKITPGGSMVDMPLLQQYLQVGGAGGGAGFESSNNFKLQPKNKDNNNNSNNNKTNDWLAEFIGTPFDINFPQLSQNIGFNGTEQNNGIFNGTNDSPTADDIPLLFRTRQIDLFNQILLNNNSNNKSGEFFTVELRNEILQRYDLQNNQFPILEDLNKYISSYESEFDKYFPFIHLPSLHQNHGEEHLPLLLAMAAIGALYSFHGTNSSILLKLSHYLIHNFMGSQKSFDHYNDIPLPIIQGLILDIYLGMFGNETDVNKITSKHLHSVICLVKSTQLNIGLENFVLPPPIIDSNTNDNPQQLTQNYEYFILAQSRIRTVHVLYYLCVLFASLLGNDIELTLKDLQNGSPCQLENLWKAESAQDWALILKLNKISIDSKFSLIQLSNGESMKDVITDLENHYSDKTLNFKTLLSGLMYISEVIYKRRMKLEKDSDVALKATKWRMNTRPEIESLIKSWEFLYVKNGGVLVPREANIHVINQTPVLKLILPLLSFAKIRKCVYFTPILTNIWSKNWDAMNKELRCLEADPELLRDGTNYSLDIVNLWIDLISISKDAEKTSIRTPIFFLTCIFAAILMIGEYLYATEMWAQNYLNVHSTTNSITSSPLNSVGSHTLVTTLNAIDRVLWLKIQNLMKKVEENLNVTNNEESFNNVNEEISKLVLEPSIDLKHTAEIITMAKLSLKSFNVGVRILADAPVWPVGLVFAEALKLRSKFINEDHLR